MSEEYGRSRRQLHSRKKKHRWLPVLALALGAAAAVFLVLKTAGLQGVLSVTLSAGQTDSGSGQQTEAQLAAGSIGEEPETETKVETESETAGETEPERETATEAEPETEAETETETEAETPPAPKYSADERTRMLTQTDSGTITFRFAGDILFDDRYAIMASLLERTGRAPNVETAFDQGILQAMRGADVFMVNNEFPYSRRGEALPEKTFTFRANPDYARLLTDMGADIVGLANNHVNDYGQQAMLDTFDTLDQVGMPFVGAGRNLSEASDAFYFTNGQVKIGIIAATQIERMPNPDTVGAGEDTPGVFRCYNPEKLMTQIRAMKESCDSVIVFVHWGTESSHQTDSWQDKQAAQFAEAGADLIIGAHPHVLQKIGFVGQVPVFYSLGNYLFSSKTLDTGLAEAKFDAQTGELVSVRFLPALQSGCRTKLLEGEEKGRVLSFLQELSPGVHIDETGQIEKR